MSELRDRLKGIRTFPSLVKFLRDELDWPLDSEDFEDLTFDYTPDELGIDAASAAKIDEIKRLRPLVPSQPWGIFFVKFEPKQLPVVALRRILNRVAVKKRPTASAAEQQKWPTDDLLFISAYGDEGERRISFAHFSQDPATGDLPTLKVLAWDEQDTGLHLDDVANRLVEHLSWPDDEDEWDDETWSERWNSAFELRHREVVTTSRALAIQLAELARAVRFRINDVLEIETDLGPVTGLMNAFREALVHDLEPDDFADMYAQTIAYGLLSARIANPSGDSSAERLPVTNPFLKELMETFIHVGRSDGRGEDGIDFDELGVSDVIQLLDDAKMEAVILDFGDKNPLEDPVIHFYELFLKEYDAKKRMQRGVFYTPRPVVSYIVRSVHEVLRTEFGLEDGLADTATWGQVTDRLDIEMPEGTTESDRFVTVLDPATGTGTFLVEAIDVIHRTLMERWMSEGRSDEEVRDLWNKYVPVHLLPRMHGYELLMAPYAIAHLKIGLKLYETGYRFASDERARVYLTNALEPKQDFSDRLEFAIPALAHEAQAVNEVKCRQRFTVVIGNPPYSNFGQLNRIPFIRALLEDYKRGLNERKLNLDDDFIKFVRLAQWLIDFTHIGVVGMITNNVFIDGLTHRRMREELRTSFNSIRVFDLHGSTRKREGVRSGRLDENVFDIQQGVGISLWARTGAEPSIVRHDELWGSRDTKYHALGQLTPAAQNWSTAACVSPHFFFVPKSLDDANEYLGFPGLVEEVFVERNAGIQTKRDRLVYSFTRAELDAKLEDWRSLPGEELRAKYDLPPDGRDWSIEWAKADIDKRDGTIARVAYRPFDFRWSYYSGRTKGFMAYPRAPLMWSALRANQLLLIVRNPRRGNIDSFFVANKPVDKDAVSPFDNVTFLPLYVYPRDQRGQQAIDADLRRVNLGVSFMERARTLEPALSPEELFNYAYAILYSPKYRERYAEFLRLDYPRLPLPMKQSLLHALITPGGELVATHLLESDRSESLVNRYIGPPCPPVARVAWSDDTVWLDAPATGKNQPGGRGSIGFGDVLESVWNFHIGGYQVCHKWLKDRKGRTLSDDEIAHYQKIVFAISETIRLMAEIDEVIEQHGGWPDAFVTSPQVLAAG